MKKGGLIFSLILLFISISFVNASGGTHSSTSVSLSIDSIAKNPDSILISNLVGSHTYAAGTSPDPGHNANQIWVSVQDGEMTLLSALQSTHKLCPASPIKTLYTSASIPNPSHLATEINLASGKTFQKAINDGDYCCVPKTCSSLGISCGSASDGCGGTLSCGGCGANQACTNGKCVSTCVSNMGTSCGGTSCVNAGTINCAGTCTGTSNMAKGTACGSGDSTSCDGSGTCAGWSGSGCGSCPFGKIANQGGSVWACTLSGDQGRNPNPGGSWGTGQYAARCSDSYSCWLFFTCSEDDSWAIKP